MSNDRLIDSLQNPPENPEAVRRLTQSAARRIQALALAGQTHRNRIRELEADLKGLHSEVLDYIEKLKKTVFGHDWKYSSDSIQMRRKTT